MEKKTEIKDNFYKNKRISLITTIKLYKKNLGFVNS